MISKQNILVKYKFILHIIILKKKQRNKANEITRIFSCSVFHFIFLANESVIIFDISFLSCYIDLVFVHF